MSSFTHYLSIVRSKSARYFSQRHHTQIAILGVFMVGVCWYTIAAPFAFTPGTTVRITSGTSTMQIAEELTDAHVIAYPLFFRIFVRLSGQSGKIQTGVYKFDTPQNVFTVIHRLITGNYGLPSVRMTFVEGSTVQNMATRIAEAFPYISVQDFLSAAQGQEGYLFPDTYFFQPSADAKTIVATLRSNFDTKIATLSPLIAASRLSLSDTVILASLIEKEASKSADRRIIAGILLNRLKLGMPLQVDAVFGYIFNRDTYSPSFTDLKVDSPYNTYTHIGLPPGPIDNPGLDAIEAVLEPTKTHYLYYLTDKNGTMHYATTYAEHQANQRKYLP